MTNTAFVLLGALDNLSSFTEGTFESGQQFRTYYNENIAPEIAQIDWAEVAAITVSGLITVALMAYATVKWAATELPNFSERLGKIYARLLGVAEVADQIPAVAELTPAVSEDNPELEFLTCKQLREILGGYKKKATKSQLLEMVYAQAA